jgi:hypothetical protein
METAKIGSREPEPLPAYIKMYEISGQDSITSHSFNRYIKDKEQDSRIKKQVEDSPSFFCERIESLPQEERAALIRQGMNNPDIEIQKAAISMIIKAPEKERVPLIKLGLFSENIERQRAAADMMWAIEEGKDELADLVLEKVKAGIHDPDMKAQKMYAEMIERVPINERTALLKVGLESPHLEVQKVFISMLWSVPKEDRASLISSGLDNPNIELQRIYSKQIWSASKEEDSLRLIVLEKVKQGLESLDPKAQTISAEMIEQVPKEAKASLIHIVSKKIRQGLENEDVEVRKAHVDMIEWAPQEEKLELFNIIVEKGVSEELIRSSLYEDKDISGASFSRQDFEKTGSEMTLIGGELKEKAILRHIEPGAFLTWQRLYEDHAAWKKFDFEYVPIEPILSYRLNKSGFVDVVSGVLDINSSDWLNKVPLFKEELQGQKRKIIDVLTQLDVKHGHAHSKNFCLRFFRQENGEIDFKRVPRLYLIDFDQAVSPE